MDEKKLNPFTLRYVKLMRIFLWVIGLWPGATIGEKVPIIVRLIGLWIPIQGPVILFGEFYFIYKFFTTSTFFVQGQCFIVTFLTVVTLIRTLVPLFKHYAELFKYFFLTIHLIHFQSKSEYHQKIYNLIDKVCYYFTWYLMCMMVFGMILFNLTPFYINYNNGAFSGRIAENVTLEYSVYYYYPFFDPSKHFKITTAYNWFLSYACASSVCGIDLLLSIMVFQIIGHLLILRHSLENMPLPASSSMISFNVKGGKATTKYEMFSAAENEMIGKKIVECVEHHKLVAQFTDDISSFFGPVLALNYAFHLFSCCLLLLECSEGDTTTILRFGPLTIIIFGQLIQISVTFEIVDTVSGKLDNSVYLTPWQFMNVQNRRAVCILLGRVQKPITVNAMGMCPVGVTTMAGILKTTFSYFAFLRQTQVN